MKEHICFLNFVPFFHLLLDIEQKILLFTFSCPFIYVLIQIELQIDAHRAPLAAISFSSNGTYIATASEQGTKIRVYLVSDATKVGIGLSIWSIYVLDYMLKAGCQRQLPLPLVTKEKTGGFVSNEALILEFIRN